jgi:hypothetical protein
MTLSFLYVREIANCAQQVSTSHLFTTCAAVRHDSRMLKSCSLDAPRHEDAQVSGSTAPRSPFVTQKYKV